MRSRWLSTFWVHQARIVEWGWGMGLRGEGEGGGGTERKRWELEKEEKDQEGNGNCPLGPWDDPDSQEWGSTPFAPVLVGFLPDISGFQQSYCSRGSLGSHGNYQRIPAGL